VRGRPKAKKVFSVVMENEVQKIKYDEGVGEVSINRKSIVERKSSLNEIDFEMKLGERLDHRGRRK
jgi:hypothetical protein